MAELYFNYVEMMKEINTYMNKFKLLSVTNASKSILENNIPALIVGEGKSIIAYVGGEEGCDSISSLVLLQFVRDICSLYEEGGSAFGFSAESILKSYTLVIIPMLNPDGSRYCSEGLEADNPLRERAIRLNKGSEDFSCWRGNARGVELKYNYGAEYGENEPEVEVGAICNFFRYGFKPDILLSFSQANSNGCNGCNDCNGKIFFGEGETENKIAIALSQMSGMSRIFRACEPPQFMISDWAITEIGAAAFSFELPNIKFKSKRQFEDKSFSCYAQIRKALFCAPFLNKIK